jgi:hypothetical protein
VLGEHGFAAAEIDALIADGVVATASLTPGPSRA